MAAASPFPAFDEAKLNAFMGPTIWATQSAQPNTSTRPLAPGGSWMIVEPFANDNVEDNLNR